jgi:Tfp pilus assembly protein FimT
VTSAELKSRKNRTKIAFSFLGLAIFPLVGSLAFAAAWQSTLTKDPPGNFPEPRPLRATYNFGWAGLTAATTDVHFSRSANKHFQLEGVGRTTGLARALWRYDVNYHAVADAGTLRPVEAQQTESVRSKKIVTHLTFSSTGVSRARTEGKGAGVTKTRTFSLPDLFDLHSALLYLRSQPLNDHSVYRVLVYPSTAAYLATISVIGREKISVHAGSYNAIKADVQLKKVGKNLELEPHRKFRRATVWLSDDADRIILRVEAQIFVGTVFAELQSVQFENPSN